MPTVKHVRQAEQMDVQVVYHQKFLKLMPVLVLGQQGTTPEQILHSNQEKLCTFPPLAIQIAKPVVVRIRTTAPDV